MAKINTIVNNFVGKVELERIKAWIDVQHNDVRGEAYYSLLWYASYDNVEYAIEHLASLQNENYKYFLSLRIAKQLSGKSKEAATNFVNNSEFASQLQKEPWY